MKEHIMTTKEFFENEANSIIEELETSDLYNISSEAEKKIIVEQKELILKTYNLTI